MKAKTGFVSVFVSLLVALMLAGCGQTVQSRVMPAQIKGKSYDMQVKGTGSAVNNNLSLYVNNVELCKATLTPVFASTKILSGNVDSIPFETECTVTTTANGWGAIRRCIFYANKKDVGESTF